MPTLEELLRTSLTGANDRFQRADKALHAAVAETAAAVRAVTAGNATLQLVPQDSTSADARYELVVTAKSRNETREVAILQVPSTGFPVQRLEVEQSYNTFRTRIVESFQTEGQLSVYFKSLVADQDSPLVAYLAYLVRTTPPEDSAVDEKVPF